jgi:hypothetical protein
MTSKLAQRERMAFTPGENTLLRHVRTINKPVSLRQLAKVPAFHGWDPETLVIMLSRLQDSGMVSWDGALVGPPTFRHAADSEEVVRKFLEGDS